MACSTYMKITMITRHTFIHLALLKMQILECWDPRYQAPWEQDAKCAATCRPTAWQAAGEKDWKCHCFLHQYHWGQLHPHWKSTCTPKSNVMQDVEGDGTLVTLEAGEKKLLNPVYVLSQSSFFPMGNSSYFLEETSWYSHVTQTSTLPT